MRKQLKQTIEKQTAEEQKSTALTTALAIGAVILVGRCVVLFAKNNVPPSLASDE